MSDLGQGYLSTPPCGKNFLEVPEQTTAQQASKVKKIIAVLSGKGGVGKSTVAAMLAIELHRRGNKAGILDADITGPSIPRLFGLEDNAVMSEQGMLPVESRAGLKVMSLNLIIADKEDPVIWRGPILSQLVTQFWTEVVWGDLDYLILDLPPGTGDIPITIFQSLPVDGVIVVTSPQQLASMVVRKAIKMVKKYDAAFYGLVENMAFFTCGGCQAVHEIFGPSRGEDEAKFNDIPFLGTLPLDPTLTALGDNGLLEDYKSEAFVNFADKVLEQEKYVPAAQKA